MSGFGILFIIFGACVFFTGLYMFSGEGHKLGLLEWRAAFKGAKKSDWKNIGKWTMVASAVILALGLSGLFLSSSRRTYFILPLLTHTLLLMKFS